jgi:hypothetical protein
LSSPPTCSFIEGRDKLCRAFVDFCRFDESLNQFKGGTPGTKAVNLKVDHRGSWYY